MIKKLIISNFRNLNSLELDFNEKVSIISGKNELGKSNALNAVCWLLTGTILTDKWGSGENDIDSIVPNGAKRGVNPEVTIVLDSNTEFKKKYVTKWSKDGSKVTGHTTEWYINDVACKNETEFNEALYPMIKFKPLLKTKDVNELRLFTDPLYALQKLDAKALRALLVDLGCSVTDEELYKKGFEELRPYGEQYMGKWDVFRKKQKEKVATISKEIENLQSKLETVADVEDFDSTEIINLNKQLEVLISKKANIKADNTNPEITELEKEIAVLKNTISNKITANQANADNQKNTLKLKRQALLDKLQHEKDQKTNPIQSQINEIEAKLKEINTNIRAYNYTIETNSTVMKKYISMGEANKKNKADLSIKLDSIINSKYQGIVTCPICFTAFAPNEQEQHNFEEHKNVKIGRLTKEIQSCEDNDKQYRAEYDQCLKLKKDAEKQRDEASDEFTDLNFKLNGLKSELEAAKNAPIDMTEINAIDKEIIALDFPVNVSVENNQIELLKAKIEAIKARTAEACEDELNQIDIEIAEVNAKISEAYVKQSKSKDKQEYLENIDKNQIELNNAESLLAKVNALIQTMISLINEKATEKTGLNFVMLEENLSNDGIKEVCYATIDNIPFKDINTAKKIKFGIKFIERLKTILSTNDLPILADRMEGIDSIGTIKTMTNEQLICTRVTDEQKITIK